MEIVVCSLDLAARVAKEKRVSHAISLLDPANAFPSLHPLRDEAHLKIGMHDIAELGVRRVSVGGALARAAWGATIRAAHALADGRFDGFADAAPATELNGFFESSAD